MWSRFARGLRAALAEGIRGAGQRLATIVAGGAARIADVIAPPPLPRPPSPPPPGGEEPGVGGGGGGRGGERRWWGQGWWDAPPGVAVEVWDAIPEGVSLRGPFLAVSDAVEYASDIPVPTRIVRVGGLIYVIVVYED